jgi:nicotinate-nucleotide adenylyltransferase
LKVGLFGGSFDPVHYGHLIVAERIRDHFHLDKIIWVPAQVNPLKTDQGVSKSRHRIEMLRLAIQGNEYFEISEYETTKEGPSYTVETLREFRSRLRKKDELFLLVGSDVLPDFHRWKDPEEITDLARIIAYSREMDTSRLKNQYPFIIPYHEIQTTISSTFIRKMVRKGNSICYLTPPEVVEYIYKEKLYVDRRED